MEAKFKAVGIAILGCAMLIAAVYLAYVLLIAVVLIALYGAAYVYFHKDEIFDERKYRD